MKARIEAAGVQRGIPLLVVEVRVHVIYLTACLILILLIISKGKCTADQIKDAAGIFF